MTIEQQNQNEQNEGSAPVVSQGEYIASETSEEPKVAEETEDNDSVHYRYQTEAVDAEQGPDADLKEVGEAKKDNHPLFLNVKARLRQRRVLVILMVIIVALITVGYYASTNRPRAKQKQVDQQNSGANDVKPVIAGVMSPEFTEADNTSALQQQQRQLDKLLNQIKELNAKNDDTSKESKEAEQQSAIETLKQKVTELQNEVQQSQAPQSLNHDRFNRFNRFSSFDHSFNNGSDGSNNPNLRSTQNSGGNNNPTQNFNSIATVNFSYDQGDGPNNKKTKLTPDNYVPAGSFALAVMLSGADANAGVSGKSDTTPLTFRILDKGQLPNGQQAHLKGCFVVASVYGDVSSERGEIRLQNLSCVQPDHQILDIPVEGTAIDTGGKEGERGNVIMRNGDILWYAGLSGFFSGIGNAMQQSLTTQSVSAQGSITTVPSGKVFQSGVSGGAGTALDKLADYYIQRAEQYHSVVQIGAGNVVYLVFLKGFSTDIANQSDNQGNNQNTSSAGAIPSTGGETSANTQMLNMLQQNFSNTQNPQNTSNGLAG